MSFEHDDRKRLVAMDGRLSRVEGAIGSVLQLQLLVLKKIGSGGGSVDTTALEEAIMGLKEDFDAALVRLVDETAKTQGVAESVKVAVLGGNQLIRDLVQQQHDQAALTPEALATINAALDASDGAVDAIAAAAATIPQTIPADAPPADGGGTPPADGGGTPTP